MRKPFSARLPEHTISQIKQLAEGWDESQAHVVIVAVDRLFVSEIGDRKVNAIMVNEDNGQYQIAPNAEPEDWNEVKMNGHTERKESLKGWGEYTTVYTLEMPPWTHPKASRTQWYFVAE